MIELMIIVAIIGILASIAIPKFGNLVSKSREAEVKASLSTIRSALSIYYADTEGVYPLTLTNSLIVDSKYLSRIPLVTIPAHSGNTGHKSVSGEQNLLAANDNAAAGVWNYINTGAGLGTLFINCTHSDTLGKIWSGF